MDVIVRGGFVDIMDLLIYGWEEFGFSFVFRILCCMCCWVWKKILVLVYGLIVLWIKIECKFKSKFIVILDEMWICFWKI